MNILEKSRGSFFYAPVFFWVLIGFIGLLGLGIRLYDLTDPPFDFHPTRQWRSALIARGMYFQSLDSAPDWQREIAVRQWQGEAVIEPPVVEYITAWGYRLAGGPHLWIPRFLSSMFWILGGVAVFLLARGMTSIDGALIATLYYLFLPYGIYASRAFQPDPLMVALIPGALWAVYRWHALRTLKSAGLAGLLVGLAIFVKSVAAFMLAGALAGLILSASGLKNAARDRGVWLAAGLAVIPTALYYVYGLWISDFLSQQLKFRFFPELLKDPATYIRWGEMATNIVGFGAIVAALVGIFLLPSKSERGMIAGLWLGYGIYSLTFPFHTITHDYYQLPLIPIVAISLAPVAALIFQQLTKVENQWLAWASITIILLSAVLFKVWDVRVNLARKDYRQDAVEWAQLGEKLGSDSQVIALTQAYGYPLAYYGWVSSDLWLSTADAELRELAGIEADTIESKRLEQLHDNDLFLVTNFNEFDRQPELKDLLYSNYEIYAQGEGYLIFDLNNPQNQ